MGGNYKKDTKYKKRSEKCSIIGYYTNKMRCSDFRNGYFSRTSFVSFVIPPTMEFAVPDCYVWCDVAFLNNVDVSLFIDVCFTHLCT